MGELKGVQLNPRDIAKLCYEQGWTDAKELTTAVQVCLSESQGFTKAYNDNIIDGEIDSRDVGIFQINIPSETIGTALETRLQDPKINVQYAWELYKRRGFQPWVAYNRKIYLRDSYVKRGVRGVANFLAEADLTESAKLTDYTSNLSTPLLDYTYRVVGMYNAIKSSKGDLEKIRRATNDPKLKSSILEIQKKLSSGLLFKVQ